MSRRAGALLGATLGALPGVGFAAWGVSVNPWFLDAPLTFFGVAVLPLAATGALVGAAVGRGRGGRALLVVEAVVLVAAALRPEPAPVPVKLLVFGLDGATWSLVGKLDLPVLAGLREQGASAELVSEEPMFSPLLWTTMASGRHPDEHGIQGFRTRSDQCRAARFWEVAAHEGLRVGLYKWLVTWPPRALGEHGFIVPAWLAPTPETWPGDLSFVKELELSRRLKRKRDTQVRPTWKLVLAGIPEGLRWSTLLEAGRWSWRERTGHPGDAERTWRLQLLRVWIDRDIFIAQLHRHPVDLATFTTYATDALGHTHWDLMEQCENDASCPPWGQAIPDAYRQADTVLGEILDNVAPGGSVLVVSDHGFRAMGDGDLGRHFAPTTERLRARIGAEVGAVDVARLGHKVVVTLQEANPAGQHDKLEIWLSALLQSSTGAPFYRWEDVPGNSRTIGLTLRDERVDAERLASDTVGGEPIADYVVATEIYSGEHDAAGILIAAGPDVPVGVEVEPAHLVDLAPTLLGLIGIPAAKNMPGQVLFGQQLPRADSYDALAHGVLAPAGAVGDDDVNTEQLKALGYIE